MKRNLLKLNLQPADRIVVPKSDVGLVQHHAIYLGEDAYGTEWIAENKIGRGVQITTIDAFFDNVKSITRIERFEGNDHERQSAVQYAMSLKGSDYDLLRFNCEHYANVVQHKQKASGQIARGFALGFIGLIVALLLNEKN